MSGNSPAAAVAALVQRSLVPGEPILVAASGGGDSTALAMLLTDTARRQGRRLIACVVDHALREGSAADAQRAADILKNLGADPVIRTLDWPNGPKASQAAARRARYGALALAARRAGTRTVFLGHTWNDQAETCFMRRESGSGARGLAAMAALSPCPVWPEGWDLALARPLLAEKRDDLRALLKALGVGWIEDPANAVERFARVRARTALAESGESEALVRSAHAAAADAAALDRDALSLADAAVRYDDHQISVAVAPDPADPVQLRLFGALACAVGAAEREPSPASVARLLTRLSQGAGGGLAGACLKPGPLIRIQRDPGGLNGRRGGALALPALALEPGQEAIWDGRLWLRASGRGWTVRPATGGGPDIGMGEGELEAHWLVRRRLNRLLWRAADWHAEKAIAAR